jgi:hypothetical protein
MALEGYIRSRFSLSSTKIYKQILTRTSKELLSIVCQVGRSALYGCPKLIIIGDIPSKRLALRGELHLQTSNVVNTALSYEESPFLLQVGGGAILSHYAGHMLITGNSFLQNYAPSGGAIHLDHAFATIASPNNFTGNQADQGPTNIFVTGSSTNASTSLCPVGNVPGIGLGEGGALTSSECLCAHSRPEAGEA